MSMQKYRADKKTTPRPDGSIQWFANWMGGPSLSKIENCRLANLAGEPRATVYITGEPDSFFSQPAVCSYRGVRMRGYITGDNDGLCFRHTYY